MLRVPRRHLSVSAIGRRLWPTVARSHAVLVCGGGSRVGSGWRPLSSLSTPTAATPTATAATTSSPPTVLRLDSQQERWDSLRTLTASLLTDSQAGSKHRAEWVHLPDLRTQPSSHRNLQQDTRVASQIDASDDDATLTSFLISQQSLASSLHQEPVLLTPTVRALWRRLASWDRKQQIQCIEKEKRCLDVGGDSVAGKRSVLSAEEGAPTEQIGWSTRGLFLDGPNGVSKSTTLYTLACMARSQNWLVVHIADGDQWVGQLAEGGATRMFVQAVYEACASTILPSTAAFSMPHSMLQLPLSPQLDYTATLVEQGIHTFGELLTLSLELADGLEETELSVECIMDQLLHLADVPMLIAIDGFDALTQKCLQPPSQPGVSEDVEALIAPISTSPFSWMNYHRSPAFRGGFLLSGESFALVQQSHPELMERIQSASSSLVDEDGEPLEDDAGEDGTAESVRPSLQGQQVEPIHVHPLPPLSPALSKHYLLHRLAAGDATHSFLLDVTRCDAAYWAFLHHRVHSGHFGLLDALLRLPSLHRPAHLAPDALREEFLASVNATSLAAFAEYFGSETSLRKNLAVFFAQHLPQGFYRDFVRNASRGPLAADQADRTQVARDYNLIAVNAGASRGMVTWVHQQLNPASSDGATQAALRGVVASSGPWSHLFASVPWGSLSKSQLHLVQHMKVELFLQTLATSLLLKQAAPLTLQGLQHGPTAPSPDRLLLSFPVRSVSHWCSASDPPLLQAEDLEAASLNAHWNLPPQLEEACRANSLHPSAQLTRLVHVGAGANGESSRVLTLVLANLDPALSDLLFVPPSRPVTALMHTLYLHYLADAMRSLEVCLGPAVQVRAHALDGSSVGWAELDDLVEAMQGGLFENADELPLQRATITHLQTHAASTVGGKATALSQHTLRVLFVSPHGRRPAPAVAELAAEASPSPSSAPAPAPSSDCPLAFHPLFSFADAIVGEDLARLLDVDVEQLRSVRWS